MAEKRKQDEIVRSFFELKKIRQGDGPEKNQMNCLLCGDEGKHFKVATVFNLKRHLINKHRDIAAENGLMAELSPALAQIAPKPRKKRVQVPYNRNEYCRSMVQWVTECSLPLNFFSKKCVRKILNPIEEALDFRNVNRSNIHLLLDQAEKKTKKYIEELLRGKMICLKADLATRKGRVILGINCQFISNGKIKVVTLAMVERFERNTAENLTVELLQVMEKFGIDIRQVYTITTDNGSNFIKAGKILQKQFHAHLESDDDDDDELSWQDEDFSSELEDFDRTQEDM